MKEKHYRSMKNELTKGLERKVFCFIMDLPKSNSSKKMETKAKFNLPEDHYSF
jgi:hypothetical protein